MAAKRILITGVSGLLGSNLAYCWKDRHELLGVYNSHPVAIKGIKVEHADILAPGAISRLIRDFHPDVVIHSAALADIDACQENQVLARQMNTEMVARLRDGLGKGGAKLIQISTDAVYGGQAGRHAEDEPVNPANYYGQTKYLGELEAIVYPRTLIVRTAFFGWNILDKRSFTEHMISKLSGRQSIQGFTDVISSMLYTFDLADLLMRAIDKDLQGAYNFGSGTSLSKYDFAVAMARVFELDSSLIKPTSVDQFHLKSARAKNLALDVSKLSKALSVDAPPMDQGIRHFHHDSKVKVPLF